MRSAFSLFTVTVTLMLSLNANAALLQCDFLSTTESRTPTGFLESVTAEFNCGGKQTFFVGSNVFVSCKPQFVLAEFANKLTVGEHVTFETVEGRTSTIDGASRTETFVRSAESATGQKLEPQTIIQHGKPVICDPTQITVN